MGYGATAADSSTSSLFEDAFEAFPFQVAIVEESGTVVCANRAWRESTARRVLADPETVDAAAEQSGSDRQNPRAVKDPRPSAGSRSTETGGTAKYPAARFLSGTRRLAIVVRDASHRAAGDLHDTIVENAPEALWLADADGKILYWNRAWHDRTGQTIEAARGDGWLAAIHPFHRNRVARLWRDARAKGQAWQIELPICSRDDRRFRWHTVQGHPVTGPEGRTTQWVGLASDIHEQKIGERALERSEQRFRRLADEAPVMVWLSDADGRAVWFNKRWLDFRGRTMSEEVGSGWRSAVHADDRTSVEAAIARAVDGRKPFEFEWRIERADGEFRWIAGWAVPAEDTSGVFNGFVASAYDITERKRDEQSRLVLIDELNHRVKNTLSIIQSIAHQSFRSGPPPEREAFTARLAALSRCHDLLTASQWHGVPVGALVARTLAPFWSGNGAEDRWVVEGPNVVLPPRTTLSLSLALHELATNAVKYGALSQATGQLVIRWRVESGTGRMVVVDWLERVPTSVEAPRQRGFGTRLLAAMNRQDSTEVEHKFAENGVRCTLRLKLEKDLG